MKIVLFLVLVLMLSSDGLVAAYSVNRRRKVSVIERETQLMIDRAGVMDWPEELGYLIKTGKANIPGSVKRRRGYTTRGNQLIARDAWAPMIVDVDKRIERIIR